MPEERETYNIPSWNFDKLHDKIFKMNKKAAKLGCPRVELEVIREYTQTAPEYKEREEILGTDASLPKITVYEVTITGEGPKINGWKFVGTLDHHTLPGQVIVKTVPGETVPTEFHNNAAICNHCNKIRSRTETFVLESDDGENKQVGRNCLRDFLGHDPSMLARYLTSLFKLISGLGDETEWFGGGSGYREYSYDHNEVLKITAAIIRKDGWVPKSSANPEEGRVATAHEVMSAFNPPRDRKLLADWKEWKAGLDIDDERNNTDAVESRAWLKSQNADNEYLHNLHQIDLATEVPGSLFGYWCSLVAAYHRSQERLRLNEASKKLNEYAGEEKEKIETVVKVMALRYISGAYGTVTLHKMLDEAGRTLIWFANCDSKMEEGNTYKIKGTIKKLEEYKDWKQTGLTRVKMLEQVEDEKDAG